MRPILIVRPKGVKFLEPSLFYSVAGANSREQLWIRLANGRIRKAELHWYEAHGIGKKEFKRKRYMD